MGLNISVDTRGVDDLLDELGDAADEAVRPAAQKGAQVLYDFVKRNVPVSKKAHMFHGTHAVYGPYSPGTLRDSIYQVYSKDNSTDSRATYDVSFNFKKAPYGFMVEYGTSKAPAKPFIRPAQAMFPAAADAMEAELIRRIKEVK